MGKIKYSSLCGIINPQTCKKNIWIDDEKQLDKVDNKDKIKNILKLPWKIEKYAEKLERDLNGLFMSLYYYIQICYIII